jgi:hypothetical protein
MHDQRMLFGAPQTQDQDAVPESPGAYPQTFEEVWKLYPGRGGHTNSKKEAFRQWQRRILQGRTAAEMLAGTKRYRAFCDHEKLTGTRHAMQASRFFGRDEHFLEPWKVETPEHAKPRRWKPPPVADEAPAEPGTLSALLRKAIRK